MLVNNFTPPGSLTAFIGQPRWLARKKEIYSQLHESLRMISDTVPLAPRMLKDIIDRSMPKLFDNKAVSVNFVNHSIYCSDYDVIYSGFPYLWIFTWKNSTHMLKSVCF
jgi:hypothetical protein